MSAHAGCYGVERVAQWERQRDIPMSFDIAPQVKHRAGKPAKPHLFRAKGLWHLRAPGYVLITALTIEAAWYVYDATQRYERNIASRLA